MHVDVREAGKEIIIVDLQGSLVSGVGDELLREVMDEVIAAGWRHIILNLREVERIDSSGIGELISGVRTAERLGSRVKLVGVGGRVRSVLELSQVLAFLTVYADEDSALAAVAHETGDPVASDGAGDRAG